MAERDGAVLGGVLHVPPGRPRSQGIGRHLMAACLRCAQQAGGPVVGLHTSPVMAAALRMYEAIGFVRDAEIAPINGLAYGRYVLPAEGFVAALTWLDKPAEALGGNFG